MLAVWLHDDVMLVDKRGRGSIDDFGADQKLGVHLDLPVLYT